MQEIRGGIVDVLGVCLLFLNQVLQDVQLVVLDGKMSCGPAVAVDLIFHIRFVPEILFYVLHCPLPGDRLEIVVAHWLE